LKTNKIMLNNQSGFTLIELMIVIGLLVIFTTLTIPYGLNFYNARMLEEETASIATVIERARAHATSGKEDSDWGVRFLYAQNQFTIFKGSSCGAGEIYQTFDLNDATELESEINCIIFERHTGIPKIYNN
ncbi:MAG: type II secretion system protein, partial [Patescibacteria group bacterium]|nr:type II secretion system protein [Patescibacteria group bacterium]